MSQDVKPVLFSVDGHPDEDQLLLALERELVPEDTIRIEQHLGNCWSCRARFDEMQRGILAFVEYREKRYLPALATPPNDSNNFRDRLRKVREEESSVSLPIRLARRFAGFIAWPRQMKWVSAVATVMVAILLWFQVFVNPPAVSANEFLARAVVAQNPPASREKSNQPRVAHQKLQIRNGTHTIVRNFEWRVGAPAGQPKWSMQADPAMWDAPMTAESFSEWRNALREKKDAVERSGHLWTLDTRTAEDRIKEAWIVVRADDFHPIEQHLRFTDDQQLDFTELDFEIRNEVNATLESGTLGQVRPANPTKQASATSLPVPVDLEDAEMQLRYTLFLHQWDLGEELTIRRASDQVVLSGTVSSKEREESMRATLSALPSVQLSLDVPSATNAPATKANTAVVTKSTALPSAPLLKEVLEKAFTSREERLAFVDRCLADSDTVLSHAWTLKRLVDRYSDADEQLLSPAADSQLREILRAHLDELSKANSALEALLKLLPGARTVAVPTPPDWRARILALFTAAQQQDRSVANLAVGSVANGPTIGTASTDLSSAHQEIDALLTGLKDMTSFPGAK